MRRHVLFSWSMKLLAFASRQSTAIVYLCPSVRFINIALFCSILLFYSFLVSEISGRKPHAEAKRLVDARYIYVRHVVVTSPAVPGVSFLTYTWSRGLQVPAVLFVNRAKKGAI